MIHSVDQNDYIGNERMVSATRVNTEPVSEVEKMVDTPEENNARSRSDNGDTYSMSAGGVKSRIELRPDYINDLATENFNTF